MQIIALSGSPLALPSLRQLFVTTKLAALLCPEDCIAADTDSLQHWACGTGLPFWKVGQANLERELAELVRETGPELVLMYGFPYSFSPTILKTVKHGGWNVHFCLGPGNEGSIVIHQLAGDKHTIIEQQSFKLLDSDKGGSPMQQLSTLSVLLIYNAIKSLKQPSRFRN